MPDEWFCEIAGREIGPLSSQQLQTMTAKGQILPTDLVRRGAAGAWMPADQAAELVAAQPEPQPRGAGPWREPVPPPPPVTGVPRAKPIAQTSARPAAASPSGLSKRAGSPPAIVQPAGSTAPAHGGAITAALSKAKQKRRQQMLATGTSVVAAAGILVLGLVWAAGGLQGFVGEIKEGGGLVSVAKKGAMSPAEPTETKGDAAKPEPKEKPLGDDAKQPSGKPTEKAAGPVEPDAKSGEDEAKWVDASMSQAVIDQVPIQIQSVAWEGRKLGTLEGAYLVIHVEVKNPSRLPDNRMMFEGWSPTAPQRWVRLTDDQQKACPAKEADPANTVANMLPIKIKAGTPAHDVLLFEAPSPKAKYLRLELSGEAFQKEGTAYFKIPASMISGVPTAADLAPPKPVKKAVVKRPAPKPRQEGPTGNPAIDFGIRPEDAP